MQATLFHGRAQRAMMVAVVSSLMLVLSCGATHLSPAAAADLVVRIEKLRSADGFVRLALYDGDERFLQSGGARAGADPKAAADGVEVVFPQFHRAATPSPRTMTKTATARSTPGCSGCRWKDFGFSNDAPVLLGPPSFADAAVSVPAEGATIVVRMRYWDGALSAPNEPVAKPQ